MTLKILKLKIFKFLLPALKGFPPRLRQLQEQYDWAFVDPKTGKYNHNNQYYDLLISNNLPFSPGTQKKVQCEFCGKVHSDNCLLLFEDENSELNDDTLTIEQFLKII